MIIGLAILLAGSTIFTLVLRASGSKSSWYMPDDISVSLKCIISTDVLALLFNHQAFLMARDLPRVWKVAGSASQSGLGDVMFKG